MDFISDKKVHGKMQKTRNLRTELFRTDYGSKDLLSEYYRKQKGKIAFATLGSFFSGFRCSIFGRCFFAAATTRESYSQDDHQACK